MRTNLIPKVVPLITLLATAAFASAPVAVTVNSARFDSASSTLTVTGRNLGNIAPAVELAGTPLTVQTFDAAAQTLVAAVPMSLPPGSYLLSVSTGNGSPNSAGVTEFEVTIGAVGPQGATGPQGPTGPTGATGPQGASVSAAPLASGDPNCANGGSAFSVGGTTTYACNGAPGPSGPQGATGPVGPAGQNGATGPQGPAGPSGPVGNAPTPPPPAYTGSFLIQINDPQATTPALFVPLGSFAGCYDKQLGVEYQDCYFQVNGATPPVSRWFNDTANGTNLFRDVVVSALDASGLERARLQISHAFLSDFKVSDANGTALGAGSSVSFVAVPSAITMMPGSGSDVPSRDPTAWSVGNFQFQIDTTVEEGVTSVSGIHMRVSKIATASLGNRHQFEPGTTQFDDILVSVSIGHSADFVSWANTVAQGQSDRRGCSLQLFTDTNHLVATVELFTVSPVSILPFGTGGIAQTSVDLSVGSFRLP